MFVSHFKNLFKDHLNETYFPSLEDSTGRKVNSEQACILGEEVTLDEIQKIMFSLANDKASAFDDYNVIFFKKAWSITGGDVLMTIKSFFDTGMLFKELIVL